MPPFQPGPPYLHFLLETLFTVASVACCWLIHFRTRESYQLSRHEGIRHFRDAFLYFGLSYLVRLLMGTRFLLGRDLPLHMILFPLSVMLTAYFSTMGIFSLALSMSWRRLNGAWTLWASSGIAFALSVATFLTRSPLLLLLTQSALLLALVVSAAWQLSRRLSTAKVLYLLVSALWLINLWFLQNPRRLPLPFKASFELLSLAVLVYVYYKVSKWIK